MVLRHFPAEFLSFRAGKRQLAGSRNIFVCIENPLPSGGNQSLSTQLKTICRQYLLVYVQYSFPLAIAIIGAAAGWPFMFFAGIQDLLSLLLLIDLLDKLLHSLIFVLSLAHIKIGAAPARPLREGLDGLRHLTSKPGFHVLRGVAYFLWSMKDHYIMCQA